jgi:hypothetical protein
MIHFDNAQFDDVLNQIKSNDDRIINVNFDVKDLKNLPYYFVRKFYYAVIIDDFPYEINDKESLLTAIYYQLKLITVHNLNWDTLQEGLVDKLTNLEEFEGLCLLFNNGDQIYGKMHIEFNELVNVLKYINKYSSKKRIVIILNNNEHVIFNYEII